MPAKTILIARFYVATEARFAHDLLEARGIHSVLLTESASTAFAGMGFEDGCLRLAVAEPDVLAASNLLAENERVADALTLPEEVEPQQDQPWTWTCPRCEVEVRGEEANCPDCAAPIEILEDDEEESYESQNEEEDPIPEAPPPWQAGAAAELEALRSRTAKGDNFALRALVTAALGLLIPLLAFYSCCLLLWIVFGQLELSAKGERRMNRALVIHTISLIIWTSSCYVLRIPALDHFLGR